MKRYKEFITEAKQVGPLWHFTNIENAHRILDSNAIYASELNDEPSVSMTRNKNFHKGGENVASLRGRRKGGVYTGISFELDGDKLSQNKKITPYNFLGDTGKNKPHYPYDESEEQVSGDIENVKPLIKRIRVHERISPEQMEKLKSHGIPVEEHYSD